MPDGESAYLVDDNGRLRPYGLDTGSLGDPLPTIADTTAGVSVLTASADGRWVAQAWRPDLDDGPTTVAVFDTSTGSLSSRRLPSMAPSGRRPSPRTHPNLPWRSTRKPGSSSSTRPPEASGPRRPASSCLRSVANPCWSRSPAASDQPRARRRRRSPVTSCCSAQRTARCGRSTPRRSNCAGRSRWRRTRWRRIRPLDDGTLLTAGRRGITRVDPGTGRALWQHDQGLADTGDSASGATCTHLAVIEEQDAFYCANAYGRLAEHDLSSGYAIGSSTPRTATAARCGPPARAPNWSASATTKPSCHAGASTARGRSPTSSPPDSEDGRSTRAATACSSSTAGGSTATSARSSTCVRRCRAPPRWADQR